VPQVLFHRPSSVTALKAHSEQQYRELGCRHPRNTVNPRPFLKARTKLLDPSRKSSRLPGSRILSIDTAPALFCATAHRSIGQVLAQCVVAGDLGGTSFHLYPTPTSSPAPHTDGDTDRYQTCPRLSTFPSRDVGDRSLKSQPPPPLDANLAALQLKFKNCKVSIEPQPFGTILSPAHSISLPVCLAGQGVELLQLFSLALCVTIWPNQKLLAATSSYNLRIPLPRTQGSESDRASSTLPREGTPYSPHVPQFGGWILKVGFYLQYPMAFQTNVFRGGEWVTQTIDLETVLKPKVQPPKKPQPVKAPQCGLLTKTVAESRLFDSILPVRLRGAQYNDVAFIGVRVPIRRPLESIAGYPAC